MDEIVTVVLGEIWYIWKAAAHFVSSGFVGLLVYWWTLTTLSRLSSGDSGFHRLPKDESGIHRYSFLLALLFAIWFHIMEDYVLDLF